MINEDSLQADFRYAAHPPFLKPHARYGFWNIAGTMEQMLGAVPGGGTLPQEVFGNLQQRYEKVVLFFIDAFGWRFLQAFRDSIPFLKRLTGEGVVSRLTSQFPSTTAAHVTSIHTGVPVSLSGIYEWFYYEPKLDDVIAPLLFSKAGERERESLKRQGADPAQIFPDRTVYLELQKAGVPSFIFQNRDYTPSSFSDLVFRGAEVSPYRTFTEGLQALSTKILSTDGPGYFFIYHDTIDATAHMYGPGAKETTAEITKTFAEIEAFTATIDGKVKNTALVFIADHGQVDINPSTTVYLNQSFPEIIGRLETTKSGTPIVPAGSARDFFLHVRRDCLSETVEELRTHLAGKALVITTDELIDTGVFGPEGAGPRLRERLASVAILPYAGESVWWYESGRFENKFLGHHGGLTPEEMETTFGLLALG